MLALKRRDGQAVILRVAGHKITIKVAVRRPDQTQVWIDAPPEVAVNREEVDVKLFPPAERVAQ